MPLEKNKELIFRELSSKNIIDYENAFFWFSSPTRLNKTLAHYDLYKCIVNLPGDVFELGVYKATSLVRWASFRNLLENDFSRKIVGMDAFGQFPIDNVESINDKNFITKFELAGGKGLDLQEIEELMRRKGFQNFDLVQGNIFTTLPIYLEENPHTRLALLHLDMDVKEPTAFALDILYDRLVPGGIVVIDDYNSVAGATEAVDEFISKKSLKLEKLTHYYVPTFFRKP